MSNILNRLYLSVTNSCNLDCKHCFRSAGTEYESELTVDEYDKILRSAKENVHSNQISITGGEPFVRRDLFEILDLTEEYDLSVDLSTNGLLLHEDNIKRLEKYGNIFYMQISIDGISKESFEFIRGKGTYKRVVKNLEILQKSDFLQQIDLMMIFLATPQNYNEIKDLPEYATEYGFDKIAIGEILPFGNGASDYHELDTTHLGNEIYKNIDIARAKDKIAIVDQFHFGFLTTGSEPTPCTAREGKVLALEPDGRILVCPYDTNVSVGNIRDFNYDIGLAYEEARKVSSKVLHVDTTKIDCEFAHSCQGGCPLILKDNNKECDYRCKRI